MLVPALRDKGPRGDHKDDDVKEDRDDDLGDGDAHEFDVFVRCKPPAAFTVRVGIPESVDWPTGEPSRSAKDDARDSVDSNHPLADQSCFCSVEGA